MTDPPPVEVERWMLIGDPSSDAVIIILVVDDSGDDELAGVIARENIVPSEHFGGVWAPASATGTGSSPSSSSS